MLTLTSMFVTVRYERANHTDMFYLYHQITLSAGQYVSSVTRTVNAFDRRHFVHSL